MTWIGDHPPDHVHVFDDRGFVVKWNLESDVPMVGEASAKVRRLIEELREEGLL